jgi:hypothetical protein
MMLYEDPLELDPITPQVRKLFHSFHWVARTVLQYMHSAEASSELQSCGIVSP